MALGLMSHVRQVGHEPLQVGSEIISDAVGPRLVREKHWRKGSILEKNTQRTKTSQTQLKKKTFFLKSVKSAVL